jgi:hypothetical protein
MVLVRVVEFGVVVVGWNGNGEKGFKVVCVIEADSWQSSQSPVMPQGYF